MRALVTYGNTEVDAWDAHTFATPTDANVRIPARCLMIGMVFVLVGSNGTGHYRVTSVRHTVYPGRVAVSVDWQGADAGHEWRGGGKGWDADDQVTLAVTAPVSSAYVPNRRIGAPIIGGVAKPDNYILNRRFMCEYFHRRPRVAREMFPGSAGMRSLAISTVAAGRTDMADAHAYRGVGEAQTAPTGDQVPTVAELSALIDGDPWQARSVARDQACMPGWCCVDCLILHANGDEPTDMSADDYAAWSAGIAASSHGYTFTLGMLTEEHDDACTPADREAGCDCERDPFRRFTCVMCSRDIAGEAHAMTPWRRA